MRTLHGLHVINLPQVTNGTLSLTNTGTQSGLFILDNGNVGLSRQTTPLSAVHIKDTAPILTLSDASASSVDTVQAYIDWQWGDNSGTSGSIGHLDAKGDFTIKNSSSGNLILSNGGSSVISIANAGTTTFAGAIKCC